MDIFVVTIPSSPKSKTETVGKEPQVDKINLPFIAIYRAKLATKVEPQLDILLSHQWYLIKQSHPSFANLVELNRRDDFFH